MGKLIFKNETVDATTPPSDYVVFYAIGDALFWRDDAGTIHSIAAGAGDVKADGTVPLTANWDVGAFKITAAQFESDIATGTAPLIVASTTAVTNLNADMLDGLEAAAMVLKADFNANTILYATTDDTPAALTVPEQTIVGRITAGAIDALTAAEVRTLINVEDGADVTDTTNVAAAGAVMDSDISEAEGFVRKSGAGTYEAIKSNLAAAVAPTANEDSGDGYAVGSRWIDTTADKEYVCLDATVAAAVWTETTGAGGGGADADAIHDNVSGEIAAITEKATPVDADLLVIEDSAATNAKKRAQIGNVRGLNETEVDARVVAVASGVKRLTWRPEADLQVHGSLAPASANVTLNAGSFGTTARVFSFDPTSEELAVIPWIVPDNWDGGTFRFRCFWTPASTNTGDVAFGLRHSFAGDGETISASSFAGSVVDTGGGTALNVQISSWSTAITVSGLVAGDLMQWSFYRAASGGTDTFTGDAHLIALEFEYSTDTPMDDG